MSSATLTRPSLDAGVLSFPAAARLVRKPPSTLRAWIRSGLTPATYGKGRAGSAVLSFHDVISLEVVRRFRAAGVSLYKVRLLESELRRRHPNVARPFALRGFYTDGQAIWRDLQPDDPRPLDERFDEGSGEGDTTEAGTVEELVGRDRGALAWKPVIVSFAEHIEFDDRDLAAAWNVSSWVRVDPRVQFGSPIIRGTRVTVAAVTAALQDADVEHVAGWYALTVEQVLDASRFATKGPNENSCEQRGHDRDQDRDAGTAGAGVDVAS